LDGHADLRERERERERERAFVAVVGVGFRVKQRFLLASQPSKDEASGLTWWCGRSSSYSNNIIRRRQQKRVLTPLRRAAHFSSGNKGARSK
jgi:hypothetical protein